MATRLQIALYWGSACGGCDVAVLDTNEFVLSLADVADVRFWPIAVDGKYHDVERMVDGELDLALYSGAVRNSENEDVAKLLRRKSRVLVALGACACHGGIVALANLTTHDEILEASYLDNPTLEPGSRTLPRPRTTMDGVVLEIPQFYRRVFTLGAIVPVDYFVPGCPPAPSHIEAALRAAATGTLPPLGNVLGASDRALCHDCPRVRGEKKVARFRRPYEIVPTPERCLLEQGLVCAGFATRSGCGARCPAGGVPCRGCYGPPPNVVDQGAKFVAGLGSIVDSRDPADIDRVLDEIPDIVGYAYRFGVAASLLQRSMKS
jgi:F420-non-reducing hydrogenase small subunit